MMIQRGICAGVAAIAGALCAGECAGQVRYDVLVLELATPDSNFNRAGAINSSGECAGYSGYYSGKSSNLNAVRWSADGHVQIVSPGNHLWAEAYDINDSATAVGVNSDRLAVIWQSDKEIPIGNLDEEPDGFAYGINNNNEVVGVDEGEFVSAIAFFWTSTDGIQQLPLPPMTESSGARAINDHGEIVGYLGGTGAVYWPSNTDEPVILGTLGELPAVATDINEVGQIVGYSRVIDSSDYSGFLWQNGVMSELPKRSGTSNARARAINNRGQIVGSNDGPVIWSDGEVIDLTDLVPSNVDFRYVEDINDWGQICGGAVIDGNNQDISAVLLTPRLTVFAPEPGLTGQPNTITIDGGTPDQRVVLVAGLRSGSTNIPGCPGLSVEIAAPQLLGATIINNFGLAEFTQFVPGYASGRTVHLAAVEPVTCRVSETISHTFP